MKEERFNYVADELCYGVTDNGKFLSPIDCKDLLNKQDKQLKLVKNELTHLTLLCLHKMEDEKLAEHTEWWNVVNEIYQSSISLMKVLYPDFAEEFEGKDLADIDIYKVKTIANEIRYGDI